MSSSEDSDSEVTAFAFSAKHQRLLLEQEELEEYGFLGRDLIEMMFERFKKDKTFEVPEKMLEVSRAVKKRRDLLFAPEALKEAKLPSTIGFMSASAEKFEKPLFEQSVAIRRCLLPVTAMACILESPGELSAADFNLLGMLVTGLRDELTESLRNLHLRRLAAKVPDKEARATILAESHNMVKGS